MDVKTRFWSKVVVNDVTGCWEWTASRDQNGYGQFGYNGRPIKAHRMAWFLVTGAWPVDKLLHRCDNPPCVFLHHLFEGSQVDNMRDAAAKGRTRGTYGPDRPPEPHPRKLTVEKVAEIRRRAASGETQRSIAADFDIHQVTVSKVIRREIWR